MDSELRESRAMIDALERELVEDIRTNYGDVSSVFGRVVSSIGRQSSELSSKIECVYRRIEKENK